MQFGKELLCGDLSAISFDRPQRMVMTILRVGHAAIGDLGHKIPQIAGIADRTFNALIDDYAANDQLPHTEIS